MLKLNVTFVKTITALGTFEINLILNLNLDVYGKDSSLCFFLTPHFPSKQKTKD